MIITINGRETSVDVSGDPESPTIILMHSIGTSSFIWQDVAAYLSTRFRVVCPDFRGHGGSGIGSGAYTIRALASDMVSVCEALNIRRLHVGGLSLGGLVAQQLAVEYPALVASMILCDTGLTIPPAAMWRERANAVRRGGVAALGDAVFDRWITPQFAATEKGSRLRDILATTSRDGYVGAAQAIADADFTSSAPSLNVPTLVVVGAEDIATPLPLSQALCDAIRGAHLHIVKNARHIPSLEYPLEVASAIADFSSEIALD